MIAPLAGQVLIVTGAARGIGRALAEEALAAGASVVAADLDRPALPDGPSVVTCGEDLSTGEGVARVIAAAVSAFGRIDGVACCAGVLTHSSILDLEPAEWELEVGIHLTGQYLMLRAAAPVLARNESGGSVLLYSSHAALIGSEAAAYSTVKAGVLGLVRTASRTLRADGVRVNGILPGAATRMTDAIYAAARHLDVPGISIASADAAGTWRDPRNVAAVPLHLLSRASAHITGQFFAVVGDEVSVLRPPEYTGTSKLHAEVGSARRLAEAGELVAGMPGVTEGVADIPWPPGT